jgi:Ca2+-transporting ATPase
MGRPLVLTPMLIAILELIIDPLCSVVLEAEPDEKNVMSRPPRDPNAPLLSRSLLTTGFLQGALAIVAVCAVFLYAALSGLSPEQVRSVGFISLICANYALIFTNRSFSASPLAGFARPNPALWVSLASAAGALVAIICVPPVRVFLHLGLINANQAFLCVGAGVVLLGALQTLKRLTGRTVTAQPGPGP